MRKVKETAGQLGLHPQTLRKMIRWGKLKCKRFGEAFPYADKTKQALAKLAKACRKINPLIGAPPRASKTAALAAEADAPQVVVPALPSKPPASVRDRYQSAGLVSPVGWHNAPRMGSDSHAGWLEGIISPGPVTGTGKGGVVFDRTVALT
jgi:hypothetical protein